MVMKIQTTVGASRVDKIFWGYVFGRKPKMELILYEENYSANPAQMNFIVMLETSKK